MKRSNSAIVDGRGVRDDRVRVRDNEPEGHRNVADICRETRLEGCSKAAGTEKEGEQDDGA
jgi:hypothetical protein